jgi:hypothetical protein
MKTTTKFFGAMILGAALFTNGCARKQTAAFQKLTDSQVAAQLKSLIAAKEAQANAAAQAGGQEVPPEFKTFFAAAGKNDWLAVSNQFADFQKRAPQYKHSGKTDERLRGTAWQAVLETYGAEESFALGGEKYAAAYGNGIIESIPDGSIYFGGTDPGRFIITAMQKSHVDGNPFFTLTQNALADGSYLDYLRSMYGDKIYIPTAADSEKCFRDYTEDAARRQQKNQLKSGEDVQVDAASGRVQISGQAAVMQINGLLAKIIFDRETNREFYVEESFPLDWMYPQLEPHGLIFKLNRQPLPQLSEEMVQHDRDFWTKTITPMIGDWLNPDTSISEIATFADKVFGRHDFSGFTGDPQFVQNGYSCKIFSKERSSIAGLYAWRAEHAVTGGEKERMTREADFAFRQALALCPYSPETVKHYVDFLKSQNRDSDAVLLGELANKFPKQN